SWVVARGDVAFHIEFPPFALEALSDGVQSAAACGHAAPGMARGLFGNATLRPLLQRFFAAALAHHLSFDAGTLAHVLALTVEIRDEAAAQTIELAVADLIARPPASTDRALLESILAGRSGLWPERAGAGCERRPGQGSLSGIPALQRDAGRSTIAACRRDADTPNLSALAAAPARRRDRVRGAQPYP